MDEWQFSKLVDEIKKHGGEHANFSEAYMYTTDAEDLPSPAITDLDVRHISDLSV